MVFRYWLRPHRLWWKPWKWRIYEWHSYEGSYYSKCERQEIATAIHAKTGRYVIQLFNTKEAAWEFIDKITYGESCA